LTADQLYALQVEWATEFVGTHGLPIISAAALVGNVTWENHAEPVTVGKKDHGSDGGFQWRLDRLDGPNGLKAWCKANDYAWNTIKGQAAFFCVECQRWPYSVLWSDLIRGTKKLETLVANVMEIYERPDPAVAHLDDRIIAAQTFLKRWSPGPSIGEIITAPVQPSAPIVIGDFQMNPALIQTLISVGVPLLETIIKAVLSAHGIAPTTPQAPQPIHVTAAPAQAPIDIDALVQKLVAGLTAALPK
jgi:hypothetical protein